MPLELRRIRGYPERMSKFLCALLLLLFSATPGLAAQAPMQKPTGSPAIAEVQAAVVAAASPAHCCPDALAPDRPAAPCPVDSGFLPASCMIYLPFNRQAHAVTTDAQPSAAASDRLLRPPIG